MQRKNDRKRGSIRRGDVDRAALLSTRKISRHGNGCRVLIAIGADEIGEGTRGQRLEIWWQGTR
jgi:hypothetical protein